MSSFRSQHRHTLANGVVVERLPLGFAGGRWWVSFIGALPGWDGSQPALDPRTVVSATHVDDPDGLLDCVGGSGSGNERECEQTWELVDHGASRARVSYAQDGIEVGSELLALDRSERDGHFAVRLTDGSLVERLPVGHANGIWRLRWVRSDVPCAELEMDDEPTLDMPHERFVRLRSSSGPIGPVGASGTLGGAVQPFGVQLPDTVSHLEVDYVVENELVASEVVALPGRRNPGNLSRPETFDER